MVLQFSYSGPTVVLEPVTGFRCVFSPTGFHLRQVWMCSGAADVKQYWAFAATASTVLFVWCLQGKGGPGLMGGFFWNDSLSGTCSFLYFYLEDRTPAKRPKELPSSSPKARITGFVRGALVGLWGAILMSLSPGEETSLRRSPFPQKWERRPSHQRHRAQDLKLFQTLLGCGLRVEDLLEPVGTSDFVGPQPHKKHNDPCLAA